jgi:8-oxo-dGTP pyrophosphatase MutT (NUDIX family)
MNKISHDSEVPANGQQVLSACAFLHHNFEGVIKVFVPKRADTKKFLPGVYEIPGGHIDYGEDMVAGLKREIQEELGKEVTIGDPFAVFTYINEVKGSHTIEVVYFGQFVGSIDDIRLNPEDHFSYAWMSKEDVVSHRDEFLPAEFVGHDYPDDPEYLNILKGFEYLEGASLKLG